MLCALTILAIFGIVLVENLARLGLWIKKYLHLLYYLFFLLKLSKRSGNLNQKSFLVFKRDHENCY